MFEGVPTYPDAGRFWDVVDKYEVNVFYTAPTAIRALSREGLEHVEKPLAGLAAAAGHRRRADQPGGLALVLAQHRQGALPRRRYLVADRDRLDPDHAAARRLPTSSRARRRCPSSACGRCSWTTTASACRTKARQTGNLCIESPWPSMMRGVYGDPERFFHDLLHAVPRPTTSPATAPPATPTATGGSPAASTTCSTSPATASAAPRSRAPSSRTTPSRRRRSSPTRTRSRARASTPTSRCTKASRPATRCGRSWCGWSARRSADRAAGRHPLDAGPAEDTLRQDHAPHPAQDRRGRVRQPGRHLDAGRPVRGRAAGFRATAHAVVQRDSLNTYHQDVIRALLLKSSTFDSY